MHDPSSYASNKQDMTSPGSDFALPASREQLFPCSPVCIIKYIITPYIIVGKSCRDTWFHNKSWSSAIPKEVTALNTFARHLHKYVPSAA